MPAPPESFYRRQPREREDEVTDAKSVKLFIAPDPATGKGRRPVTSGTLPCAERRDQGKNKAP